MRPPRTSRLAAARAALAEVEGRVGFTPGKNWVPVEARRLLRSGRSAPDDSFSAKPISISAAGSSEDAR